MKTTKQNPSAAAEKELHEPIILKIAMIVCPTYFYCISYKLTSKVGLLNSLYVAVKYVLIFPCTRVSYERVYFLSWFRFSVNKVRLYCRKWRKGVSALPKQLKKKIVRAIIKILKSHLIDCESILANFSAYYYNNILYEVQSSRYYIITCVYK